MDVKCANCGKIHPSSHQICDKCGHMKFIPLELKRSTASVSSVKKETEKEKNERLRKEAEELKRKEKEEKKNKGKKDKRDDEEEDINDDVGDDEEEKEEDDNKEE